MQYTSADHTFIVCAYGESPYLEECLSSLSAQTIPTQVLIATSTPNGHIQRLADAFGYPALINHGEAGIAGDWNFALSCAKVPLVTLAHQDDIYCEMYAEHMIELVNRARDPLIYFCDYGEIRDGEYIDRAVINQIKRLLVKPLKIPSLQDVKWAKRVVLSLGNPICCPSVTYNMPKLEMPIFKTGMKSNLDWETWERLSLQDGSFVYDARVGMRHRVHEGSETTACIIDNTRTREDLLMLKKFWPAPFAGLINKIYNSAQRYN